MLMKVPASDDGVVDELPVKCGLKQLNGLSKALNVPAWCAALAMANRTKFTGLHWAGRLFADPNVQR